MAEPEQYVKTGETAVPEGGRFDPTTKTWSEAPAQDQWRLQWAPTRKVQDVWHVDPIDGMIFPEAEGAKVGGVWHTLKNAQDLVAEKAGETPKVQAPTQPTLVNGRWTLNGVEL